MTPVWVQLIGIFCSMGLTAVDPAVEAFESWSRMLLFLIHLRESELTLQSVLLTGGAFLFSRFAFNSERRSFSFGISAKTPSKPPSRLDP
jgi:hypothetical protein